MNNHARPRLRLTIVALAALLSPSTAALRAQTSAVATTQPGAVASVDFVQLTVSDLDRAVSFFVDVLTFEKVSETERSGESLAALEGLPATAKARIAQLRLGDERIELAEYSSPPGRPMPADSRSNDRWFQHIAIIVRDIDKAHARLAERGVQPASKGPQRLPDWNKNAAGIQAFYFRDPDGHFLELLQFPPDKGDPKWRRANDRLFLGIDHTAIVVGDTEESVRFYRDVLGFSVAGSGENYGPEQEALNNVPGAHLRITTLRGASGPAIEFLEYLAPRDGRPYPADARASDVLRWRTSVRLHDIEGVAQRLRAARAKFVPLSAMFVARDPDGHALMLTGQ